MKREKLHSSDHIDIEYDVQDNFLYANWKGFQTVDNVKGGCGKMLEFLKRKNCTKVLNDNRQVTGPWQGAAEWGAKEWFPRMFEAGLKHFAWIQSPSVFSQLSAQKLVAGNQDLKQEETMRDFDNEATARAWLVAR